ncbi:MAG: Lrp/AsnC family transcriptional regulator [Candidatus Helarchaeota archaeon]|nr:Lrp/AsnC family transcriptional regulator [Candidatus Helarchaeota archaeon]
MRRVTEKDAYEVIRSAGSQGLLQSDLWRSLNTNSREGSRIATKLEKKGLVRRARELCEGRWTYRLYVDEKIQLSEILWCTLDRCPCFICKSLPQCGLGQTISPTACSILDTWLIEQAVENNGKEIPEEKDESSN